MPIRIHQFHSGSAYGDAVTNSMLLLQDHLHEMGFESDVFVEHLDDKLADRLRPHTALTDSLADNDILIVRHSMGHDLLDWVLALPGRKVLMYHNITPAEFFEPGSPFHHYATLGRQQLTQLLPKMEHAFADSGFNAAELRSLGYAEVDVLPVLVRDAQFADVLAPRCLETGTGRPWTVLFVGRVCENKGHQDLVEVAKAWVERFQAFPIQFICIGSYSRGSTFYSEVRARIEAAGLEGIVHFVGKVTDTELRDWYARADCYLSLSRHEGFGVPLIEAMLSDLPVVALDAAAVAETLGGAGILLPDASASRVTDELFALMRNRARRRAVLASQRDRVHAFGSQAIRAGVVSALQRLGVEVTAEAIATAPQATPAIRIEGPCESTYSLAIVNRELALALDASGRRTSLFCTEGPGDYTPAPAALARLDPRARELIQAGADAERPALAIRNLYPPRVRDLRGETAGGYFFWEESSFPSQYVADFNLSLDVLFAPSRFVADVWRTSGVNVPIHYVGTGADHVLRSKPEPLPSALPAGYKFLHVSSCFPRKGPDVLLKAWGRAFAGRRDVHLIVKTFANPHNRIAELLDALRAAQADYPPVTLLMDDYTPGQIAALYEACDAYVAPSRGEGFGLPMAEAMLHGLPVIATGWGGHTDFCTERTSFPIRYQMARSSSHLAGKETALWAEPDEAHLAELLRAVHADENGEVASKVAQARALVTEQYSWDAVAKRLLAGEAALGTAQRDFAQTPLRLGWVSTWNEACGIAAYSRYLLDHLPRGEVELTLYGRTGTSVDDGFAPISHHWRDTSDLDLRALGDALLANRVEVAVLQFNFGFFEVRALGELVQRLEAEGVRVIVVLHSTKDVDRADFKASLRDAAGLERASRILVHSPEDLNRLIDYGYGACSALFPHGAVDGPQLSLAQARERLHIGPEAKIIASYGFMLPHKGLPELVEAFAEVARAEPNAYLFLVNSLFPAEVSERMRTELLEKIERLKIRERVRMFTDFLPEQTSLALLSAADIVVFPYQNTAESSSAAVRFGLAAHRPVACTPLGIFSDLEGQGLRFRGTAPRDLAADLRGWLNDPNMGEVVAGQDEWLHARSLPRLMARLTDLCRGLVLDRSLP